MRTDRGEFEALVADALDAIHEVAHHFGISDERLRELGWA
jgi:predicted Zn-dependent protease with MMP-like domain